MAKDYSSEAGAAGFAGLNHTLTTANQAEAITPPVWASTVVIYAAAAVEIAHDGTEGSALAAGDGFTIPAGGTYTHPLDAIGDASAPGVLWLEPSANSQTISLAFYGASRS